MIDKILEIINLIRDNKDLEPIKRISLETKLRDDLEFDSLDLAEFTVHVESEFGIDVFEDGLVETIGEVLERLKHE